MPWAARGAPPLAALLLAWTAASQTAARLAPWTGGAKDGKTRAANLTAEQRRESARKATRARWERQAAR